MKKTKKDNSKITNLETKVSFHDRFDHFGHNVVPNLARYGGLVFGLNALYELAFHTLPPPIIEAAILSGAKIPVDIYNYHRDHADEKGWFKDFVSRELPGRVVETGLMFAGALGVEKLFGTHYNPATTKFALGTAEEFIISGIATALNAASEFVTEVAVPYLQQYIDRRLDTKNLIDRAGHLLWNGASTLTYALILGAENIATYIITGGAWPSPNLEMIFALGSKIPADFLTHIVKTKIQSLKNQEPWTLGNASKSYVTDELVGDGIELAGMAIVLKSIVNGVYHPIPKGSIGNFDDVLTFNGIAVGLNFIGEVITSFVTPYAQKLLVDRRYIQSNNAKPTSG